MRGFIAGLVVSLLMVSCRASDRPDEHAPPVAARPSDDRPAEARSLQPPYDPESVGPRYEGSAAEAVSSLGLGDVLESWPEPSSRTFEADLQRDLEKLRRASSWLKDFRLSRESEVDAIYAAGMVGSARALVDKALSGTENTIRFIGEDRLDLARSSFAMRRNVSRRFVRELGNAADTVDD
jgi:hypothetical protein